MVLKKNGDRGISTMGATGKRPKTNAPEGAEKLTSKMAERPEGTPSPPDMPDSAAGAKAPRHHAHLQVTPTAPWTRDVYVTLLSPLGSPGKPGRFGHVPD